MPLSGATNYLIYYSKNIEPQNKDYNFQSEVGMTNKVNAKFNVIERRGSITITISIFP